MKKAILIGGTGFLGSQLLKLFCDSNIETIAIVHKSGIKNNKELQVIDGGISAITKNLIDSFKPDVIYHCARPTLPRFRKLGRKLAARKAFKLNTKLIRTIQSSVSKPKLVFASGSLMYGNSSNAHDEMSPLNPISYARQYYSGERPVNDAVINNNFPVIIMRFPWLLGNGSWFKWFYLENIKKNNAIPEFGVKDNLMEIIDVDNAAKLMQLYGETMTNSGVFNILSGKPISQSEFLDKISDVFNVPGKQFTHLFNNPPEYEAIEAFCSNITLRTNYSTILDDFHFTSIRDVLKRIKKENNID